MMLTILLEGNFQYFQGEIQEKHCHLGQRRKGNDRRKDDPQDLDRYELCNKREKSAKWLNCRERY